MPPPDTCAALLPVAAPVGAASDSPAIAPDAYPSAVVPVAVASGAARLAPASAPDACALADAVAVGAVSVEPAGAVLACADPEPVAVGAVRATLDGDADALPSGLAPPADTGTQMDCT